MSAGDIIDFATFDRSLSASTASDNGKASLLLTSEDRLPRNYAVAVPLLEAAGLRALFFVVSEFSLKSGQDACDFCRERIRSRHVEAAMTPGQIADLAASGHTTGNHTLSHANLRKTPPAGYERQIIESAAIIESWIGRPVDTFAWPFTWRDYAGRVSTGRRTSPVLLRAVSRAYAGRHRRASADLANQPRGTLPSRGGALPAQRPCGVRASASPVTPAGTARRRRSRGESRRVTSRAMPALAALLCLLAGGCGGNTASQGSPPPTGPPTAPSPVPEPAPPLVTFGPGRHRVGSDIAPGRYFSGPGSGCYWERQSGTGGTAPEAIAFGYIGVDAPQWIIDIRSTDHAFATNDACGTWSNRAREGSRPAIAPGVWLVGAQVRPGMYTSSVSVGCYWERLSDFSGDPDSIIARELAAAAGTAFVTVFPGDAGFRTDAACGSWTPAALGTTTTNQAG